jgi:hypothetical protein
MKNKISRVILSITILFFSSCLGDKKAVNIAEMEDSTFINTNFKGNLINYEEGMSACDKISVEEIASLYNVTANLIHIEDPTKSDRYKKNMKPVCNFYLESGSSDFEWLRGSIGINREVGKDEYMGDVAEAVGSGENWDEAWAMKKAMSKSSEWIPNLGKAALWNESKKILEIKMEGYTLIIIPLKNRLNKTEVAKNRDYKKLALEMAKASGYIN